MRALTFSCHVRLFGPPTHVIHVVYTLDSSPGRMHATFQRNILQNCWIVLWDVMKELAKCAQILKHQKMLQQEFDHFQTLSNTIQHVATWWPNSCNTFARNNLAGLALGAVYSTRFRWRVFGLKLRVHTNFFPLTFSVHTKTLESVHCYVAIKYRNVLRLHMQQNQIDAPRGCA